MENQTEKISILKLLSGSAPLMSGVIKKPDNEIFYIPNIPYLPKGTLRDLVIYPVDLDSFRKSGRTDEFLFFLFKFLECEYLQKNLEKGFDTKQENWENFFKKSEKQKIGIIRLFYRIPKFAIMDNCISELPKRLKIKIYQYAKSIGITLLTISPDKTLWKFHDYILRISNEGKFSYEKIEVYN